MKNTIKKLAVLLVFLFAILISSCELEKDFIEKSVDNKGIQLKKISFSELKSNPKAFQKLKEARLKKNPNFLYRGVYNEDYGVFIDTTNIIVIQKEDKHSITFQIVDEDFTNKVENLVLNSKEDGSYEAYITEYILSQEDFNIIANGEILPAKEPSAITKIENLSRVDIFGGAGGCFTFTVNSVWVCRDKDDNIMRDNGELGNGCVGTSFYFDYNVLTVDYECLEAFTNASGGSASSSGGTSGSSGSGGSSGSSGSGGFAGTGTIGGIGGNSGSNNSSTPLMTTPLVNENKNEVKLLNGFNTQQTEWWFNAPQETKEDILKNIALNNSTEEARNFANDLIDLAINEPEQEDVNNLVNLSILIESCSDEEFFTDEFAQKLVQYTDLSLTTLPPNYPISLLSIKTFLNYKKLRQLNPEWSRSKCLWEATKEIVHLSLDAFGLIPVGGEIADLINGVLYTIEGDKLNATLSYASAVPVAGWATASVKFAIKIKDVSQTAYTISTKVKLVWKNVGGVITFGDRNQLRNVLGMGTTAVDARQAHHLIPWERSTHPLVQKAAKSGNAFHMNEALNGIPRPSNLHLTGHSTYNTKVKQILDNYNFENPNLSINDSYNFVSGLANHIRTLINNNPTLNSGQIANLISYP
jgi:hypothetical protein